MQCFWSCSAWWVRKTANWLLWPTSSLVSERSKGMTWLRSVAVILLKTAVKTRDSVLVRNCRVFYVNQPYFLSVSASSLFQTLTAGSVTCISRSKRVWRTPATKWITLKPSSSGRPSGHDTMKKANTFMNTFEWINKPTSLLLLRPVFCLSCRWCTWFNRQRAMWVSLAWVLCERKNEEAPYVCASATHFFFYCRFSVTKKFFCWMSVTLWPDTWGPQTRLCLSETSPMNPGESTFRRQ